MNVIAATAEVRGYQGPRITAEELVSNRGWMHRLARDLLHDAALADDVVQDAFVAALERPPHSPDRLQSWLNTVTRNFVKLSYRERSRREARERRVARPEATAAEPPSLDLTEIRAQVAAEVVTLPEPYRSTLILLFYQDRSARDVARDLGLPESTLRVRKVRALKMLEKRLARAEPPRSRREAVLLFVPFALDPGLWDRSTESSAALAVASSSVRPLGGPAAAPSGWRRRSVALGATLVGLALVLWFAIGSNRSSVRVPGPETRSTVREVALGSSFEGATNSANGRGRELPGVAPSDSRSDVVHLGSATVRVVDARSGRPIPRASVSWGATSLASERLAQGQGAIGYLMQPFDEAGTVATDARGECTVPRSRLRTDRLRVVAEGYRTHRESARFRDPDEPYAIALELATLARVELRAHAEGREVSPAGIEIELLGSEGDEQRVTIGPSGVAAFVWANHDYVYRVGELPWIPTRGLATAPLTRIEVEAGRPAAGWVVDAEGDIVPGATVALDLGARWPGGPYRVESDATGRLAVPALPSVGSIRVEVSHSSFVTRVATIDLPWLDAQQFVLDDGRWIEGRVTVPEGESLEGAIVGALSGSSFRRRELPQVEVAADGTFRLGPLEPDELTVFLEHPRLVDQERVLGADQSFVEFELETGREVTGRVVFPDGSPAEGVGLSLGSVFGDEIRSPEIRSGRDGAFRFRGLPTEPFPVRALRSDDVRWSPLRTVETSEGGPELRSRALLLQVLRPHQLLSVDGRPIENRRHYGSVNTALIDDQRDLLLVVDSPTDRTAPPILVDALDRPVRTLVNLIIVPEDEPESVLVTFAGTSGDPFLVPDPRLLEQVLVGYWTREYAVAFDRVPAGGEREGRILRLDPIRSGRVVELSVAEDAPIFVAPFLDGIDPKVALYWGRASRARRPNDGREELWESGRETARGTVVLEIPDLGPGRYSVLTTRLGGGDSGDATSKRWVPKRSASRVTALVPLGTLDIPAQSSVAKLQLEE